MANEIEAVGRAAVMTVGPRVMVHAGAHHATREEVALTTTPDRTKTWMPIPHETLLTGVQGALERAGLALVSESHALARSGDRYFGLLRVSDGNDAGDFGLTIGVRNSHDQSFPFGLVVGATVFVCDNLSFSGEVKLSRKHTAHIGRDLPQLINAAVARLGDLRRTQDERFATYKLHELTDAAAHDLLILALDARVLPVTKVPLALEEWRHPRHREFCEGKTAWRLFNSITEAVKGGDLQLLPRRTQALHGLLDAACGLTTLAA
ncbi:MAG: DUF945 domain-containing protein [Planctomycetes bacterium]|nr:DUF945 domain-containing protein [Planctomycetota bacterium]